MCQVNLEVEEYKEGKEEQRAQLTVLLLISF
jgi:hypothetical protein